MLFFIFFPKSVLCVQRYDFSTTNLHIYQNNIYLFPKFAPTSSLKEILSVHDLFAITDNNTF